MTGTNKQSTTSKLSKTKYRPRCGRNRNWGGTLYSNNRLVHHCGNECCKGCKNEFRCPKPCSFRHNCDDVVVIKSFKERIINRLKGRGW